LDGSSSRTIYLRDHGATAYLVSTTTTSAVGGSTLPVYINSKGVATKCGDSLAVSITGNAASASSVAWGGVTGKPSTFPPDSHAHDYLPLSGGTLSGLLKWSNALTQVTSPTVVAAFIGNDSANGLGYASASDLSVGYATKVKLASTGISATATTDALLEAGVRFDTVAAAGTSINNDGVVATFGYSSSWGA
jgi:hypothetical protein